MSKGCRTHILYATGDKLPNDEILSTRMVAHVLEKFGVDDIRVVDGSLAEHHCIIYDEHPIYELKARCLGHGGMPAKRKDLADLTIKKQGEDFAWRRLKSDLTPNGLCLDGPNEFIVGHESKYLPHGYMTLHFDGNQLVEKVRSPRGLVLYKATLG